MSKDSDNVLLMKRLYWWLCFWDKNLLYSQAVLELAALLSRVFCCWNNRQVSPHLALHCLPSFFFKCGNYRVSWSMLNTSGKSVFLDNSFMHSMDNHSFVHSLSTSFIFAWLFLTLRLGELASRALYHNENKMQVAWDESIQVLFQFSPAWPRLRVSLWVKSRSHPPRSRS